jgi:hypothetical protein
MLAMLAVMVRGWFYYYNKIWTMESLFLYTLDDFSRYLEISNKYFKEEIGIEEEEIMNITLNTHLRYLDYSLTRLEEHAKTLGIGKWFYPLYAKIQKLMIENQYLGDTSLDRLTSSEAETNPNLSDVPN